MFARTPKKEKDLPHVRSKPSARICLHTLLWIQLFKIVFLTAAIGTLFFITLCLVLVLIAGKEAPPLFEKVIMGFFDLAKIGFGSVVGLLGGRKLQAENHDK
jgi:hypothetical protein